MRPVSLSEPESPRGGGADAGSATKRRRELAVQMTAMGLEFSGSVLGGLALGFYLDDWLGTAPWLLMVFTFGGMLAAVTRLLVLTRRFQRIRSDRDS